MARSCLSRMRHLSLLRLASLNSRQSAVCFKPSLRPKSLSMSYSFGLYTIGAVLPSKVGGNEYDRQHTKVLRWRFFPPSAGLDLDRQPDRLYIFARSEYDLRQWRDWLRWQWLACVVDKPLEPCEVLASARSPSVGASPWRFSACLPWHIALSC